MTKDGTPKPVILLGKNGTGKTLFISNIIHSLIEMKRNFYNELQEVSKNRLYRVSSKTYITRNSNHAYHRITYNDGKEIINFTNLMTDDYNKFKNTFDIKKYPGININHEGLREQGFFESVEKPKHNIFEKNIFLFFPVERYYIPTWENENNENLSLAYKEHIYVGYSENSMIKYNLLQSISSWILDVIVDKILFVDKNEEKNMSLKKYFERNKNISDLLENILTNIFSDKYKSVEINITPSVNLRRQILIVGKKENGNEEIIVHTFKNLSSGEIMIFGMIATILQEYDRICDPQSVLEFKDISGIVLIDEIDLHLHIDLLRFILPSMIKLFPNIQFIITSHSPFFTLGMKETFGDSCQFVMMPTGTIINQPKDFDEVSKCFGIIDKNYKEIIKTMKETKNELESIKKPIVITEGKTDWKHIKHALTIFQSKGEFTDLDIQFLEYEDNRLNDSKLEILLKNLAQVAHPYKIIGIFDNDTGTGNKYLEPKCLNNNVYACSIKDTQGYPNGIISIELLYPRNEIISTFDENNRRLYLSDEFMHKSHKLKENKSIICNSHVITEAQRRSIVKIIDNEVFDDNENNIALSKADFAKYVYNNHSSFAKLSIDGFRQIIDTIRKICTNEK